MAEEEAVKFPGTDLSLVEITENSWRLDHPDFGDVYKTTYAKGVITDFQQPDDVEDPDDPFTVESMVKVEVEGGEESDFIPLFYHPKKGYWDDPDFWDDPVLAEDYDEEKGYFKKAWMSFRCGDEVVVMMREGKPVAVVGFADGYPRPAEDIFKLEMDSPPIAENPWECLEGEPFFISINQTRKLAISVRDAGWTSMTQDEGDLKMYAPSSVPEPEGEEGLEHRCTLEAEVAKTGEETSNTLYPDEPINFYYLYGNLERYGYEPPRHGEMTYGEPLCYYLYHRYSRSKWFWKVCVWSFVVGPFVVAIYCDLSRLNFTEQYYRADVDKNGHGVEGEHFTVGPYPCDPPGTPPSMGICFVDGGWNKEDYDLWHNYWHQNCVGQAIHIVGGQPKPPPWVSEETSDAPDGGSREIIDPYDIQESFLIKIGLYKPGVLTPEIILGAVGMGGSPFDGYRKQWTVEGREIDGGVDWWDSPDGLFSQTGLNSFFDWGARQGLQYYGLGPDFDFSTYSAPDEFHFFTRPHTKDELMEAGMWPGKE